jgi:hypothetical protein
MSVCVVLQEGLPIMWTMATCLNTQQNVAPTRSLRVGVLTETTFITQFLPAIVQAQDYDPCLVVIKAKLH